MLKLMLTGNLGGDPEKRYTQDGKAVLSFRVAVNSRRKVRGASGGEDDWEDHTDWFRVTIRGGRVDYLSDNLRKGSRVTVIGGLSIGEYQARDSDEIRASYDVYADDVDFYRDRSEGNGGGERREQEPRREAAPANSGRGAQQRQAPAEDLEDLPC